MVGKVSETQDETIGPEADANAEPAVESIATSAQTSDNKPPKAAKTSDRPDAASKSTPARKTATQSKPTTKKPSKARSKAVIQSDLAKLETRLKRADSVTRKSVQSLETVVSTLESTLKKSQTSQKGQLTKHVNRLTRRLDSQVDETKALIRRELREALAGAGTAGGIQNLNSALSRASARMDEAEMSQAAAITRVNRHLADIARAVDARLKEERAARDAERDDIDRQLAETAAKLTDRVAIIERDSARAFDKIGETMEQLHRKVEQRRAHSETDVGARISDLATQTQAGFDAYQSRVEQRFEEMESRHLAVGTGVAERAIERVNQELDQKIDALKSRLAELERQPVAMPAIPAPVLKTVDNDHGAQPAQDSQTQTTLRDRVSAFKSPSETTQTVAPVSFQQNDAANPYAAALGASATSGARSRPVIDRHPQAPLPPIDLDKTQITQQPNNSPVVAFPVSVPPAAVTTTGTPPLPPFQMPDQTDFEPAPLPEAVYANPAYADDNMAGALGSPRAERVAGDTKTKRRGLDLSAINFGSPKLRTALLAGGALIVAILAARMILGTGSLSESTYENPNRVPVVQQTQPATTGTLPIQGYTLPTAGGSTSPLPVAGTPTTGLEAVLGPETVLGSDANAPIGEYVERQPVNLDTAELDTLEAAVEAGNPIAQFQMGLAKLDAGDTDEGAALVREAASANQPAALYRLAKLYEAGEGVPQDETLARQLIERAARGGNRIAMHDLALYYAEGRGGVEMNMLTAKAWFEQAARRDVVDSQYNLAVLSESPDTGAEPDTEEAFFWYSLAAQQGDQFAIQRRDALRASFDPATLSQIDTRLAAFQPREIDEAANGIFTNLPWVQADTPATPAQIRTAQTRLTALGYQVGTPDGIMGERTRSAIISFQRENGMRETGLVNAALLNRLSQAGGA